MSDLSKEPIQIELKKKEWTKIVGKITALALANNIEGKIYLIGSFARNEQTNESDIDLFVISKPDEQRRISQIATMIEWEYEIPVQIVTLYDLENIPPEAILIYASPLKT